LQFSFSQVGLQSRGKEEDDVLALVGGELPLLLVLGLEGKSSRIGPTSMGIANLLVFGCVPGPVGRRA
jgi:hypothetical protein